MLSLAVRQLMWIAFASFDGMRPMRAPKDFILLLVIFFVWPGVFRGITTQIEQIV